MNNIFKGLTVQDLHDLREIIRDSSCYDLEVRSGLIKGVTEEICKRELVELMMPLAKEFIAKKEMDDV